MENTINTTIFAKRLTNSEGKTFYKYITKLNKTDGSTITAQVSFRGSERNCPDPENCPMNIIVTRDGASLATKTYVDDETEEVRERYVLWVGKWEEGEPYIDHSLDDVF